MKEFKIGDKVRIRKDLKVGESYGADTLVNEMTKMLGKVATIEKIWCGGKKFAIKEDGWKWTPEMFESNASPNKLIFRDNATILIKDGKRYVAKCEAGDTYDREKGLLVCLAKANGITFNDIQEMLNNAEVQGDKDKQDGFIRALNSKPLVAVKEVKRQAKVGEYVKVVNASNTRYDEYENGDILKIVEYNGKDIFKHSRAYYKDEICKYLSLDEYVVLENYKPKK